MLTLNNDSFTFKAVTKTTKQKIMSNTDNYIGIQIEPATKKQFKELCSERGSNMSVEIKRFIYEELKKAKK